MLRHDRAQLHTFLGFDLSTQKLKAIQLNENFETKAAAEVDFDKDLPEYGTKGGAHQGKSQQEFFVPTVMWVKALDVVLERLKAQGADFTTVIGISGSAQQHGSVYWSSEGILNLKNLDPKELLHMQVKKSSFVFEKSPIWMDSSTGKQCEEMEAAVGGAENMISITGSKCYPRFTGPQIRKLYQQYPVQFENVKRISLVSSFLASLFLGDIAPIDYADASGMNLFDINTKSWSQDCLNACASNLKSRLGEPVHSCDIVGTVSSYFVTRYGFPSTCRVVACSGDNPSALSGLMFKENTFVISLGTSDTVMMNLKNPNLMKEGHVFCHPIEKDVYMGMLCYRNGSLVRENMKFKIAENSWDYFNTLLDSCPKGNNGCMAVHYPDNEIVPNVKGILRWTENHCAISADAKEGIPKFNSPAVEIRALIEGQVLHRRAYADEMGFKIEKDTIIVATGGASANKSILQVISDVFKTPVYITENTEAAMLGAAYRAMFAVLCRQQNLNTNFYDFIIRNIPHNLIQICGPTENSDKIYEPMIRRFQEMIRVLS